MRSSLRFFCKARTGDNAAATFVSLRDWKNAHSIEHAREGRDVGKDMVRRRHVRTEA